MKADVVIDAKGLACPMPIVKAKKGIETLQSGQVMELYTTDHGAKKDFAAWVKQTGHEMLETKEENGVYTFFVKKA